MTEERACLNDVSLYSWEIEPEFFSDVIVAFIFKHGGPDDLYAFLYNKPKFSDFNQYLSDIGHEEEMVIGCYWKDYEDESYCGFRLEWLIRLLDELALKQEDEDMRFVFELNSGALKSLKRGFEKHLKEKSSE
jgi:hypothetical protein